MKKITLKKFEQGISDMRNAYVDGVVYFPLDKTEDGKTIALVLGYEEGYDKGETYQAIMGDVVLTLCGKIAVNVDDLQCDYDFDWYMPWGDGGDIYDTNTALTDDHKGDLNYFMGEAENIIKLMKEGVLTIK
jgi:hypothetical protein